MIRQAPFMIVMAAKILEWDSLEKPVELELR
jgi:hypothetical protein